MLYIGKTQKAINLAIKVHEIDQKQVRKSKQISYISHPLTVAIILSKAGADEDIVVAGILHDTMEDSIEGKKITPEILEEKFNKRVAKLVASVSEKDKDLPWVERKKIALEHIKNFSRDSLFLKAADVISNTADIVVDYKEKGDKMFEIFNAPEPKKENKIQNYLNYMKAILNQWPGIPLKEDLKFLIKELERISGTSLNKK